MVRIVIAALLIVGCATPATTDWPVYQVKIEKGDTLAALATKYDTTWQAIAALNGLSGAADITVGKTILVKPGPGGIVAGYGRSEYLEFLGENTPTVPAAKPAEERRGLLFDSNNEAAINTEASGLHWPVVGDISSYFGKRGRKPHTGIDIRAPKGTPIQAPQDGVIEFSGRRRGYGKTVVINHGSFKTLYAHCDTLSAKTGQKVKVKDVIAAVGRTGNASGMHLHFEVRSLRDIPEDPLPWLRTGQLSQNIIGPTIKNALATVGPFQNDDIFLTLSRGLCPFCDLVGKAPKPTLSL